MTEVELLKQIVDILQWIPFTLGAILGCLIVIALRQLSR
jgi:hypothetical protein